MDDNLTPPATFSYSPWRHGGWYVHTVRYPGGSCGCVSDNFVDRKWRIACDERPFEEQPTFKSRDDAARAEWEIVQEMHRMEAEHSAATGEPPDSANAQLDPLERGRRRAALFVQAASRVEARRGAADARLAGAVCEAAQAG